MKDQGEWRPAPGCALLHPYGQEGWLPGTPNRPHEHWHEWEPGEPIVNVTIGSNRGQVAIGNEDVQQNQ